MRAYTLLFFIFARFTSFAQHNDSLENLNQLNTIKKHLPTLATLNVGFIDYFRSASYYTLPAGYQKSNTTGFLPMSAKIEYGINSNVYLVASFYYDNFIYNFDHLYYGNGITFRRYQTNQFILMGGGLGMSYCLNKYIHVKNLEPFITIGFSLNNVHQNSFPQADSTVAKTDHIASPCIKAGARYYVTKSKKTAIYCDFGYDRQSFLNLGFSCVINRKKGKHLRL